MSKARFLLCLTTALLLLLGLAPLHAERPAAAEAEIEFLLQRIQASSGKFIRDGKEYGPAEAVDHLRTKLKAAGDRVKSADDFIDGIATKSYLNGKPYFIQLNGQQKPTGPWLKQILAERRAAK